jgi:hypothetical protein
VRKKWYPSQCLRALEKFKYLTNPPYHQSDVTRNIISSENLCYFFLSKTAKKNHFHKVKLHHWEDEVADLRILRLNVKNPPTCMQKFRNKNLMQIMEKEGYGYTFYLQDCKAKYSTVILWKYTSIVSIFRCQNKTNTRKMSEKQARLKYFLLGAGNEVKKQCASSSWREKSIFPY